MQITESIISSTTSNPKTAEGAQGQHKSGHHQGFCGVFEQLEEREDLNARTIEAELDQGIDAEPVDQDAMDAETIDRPEPRIGRDGSIKNPDELSEFGGDNLGRDIANRDAQDTRLTEAGAFAPKPPVSDPLDTGFCLNHDLKPTQESGSNPILGQQKGDDRERQYDGRISHFGPRSPSSIEVAMVGQMRFEGIGKAEFEMPPSTISQHVTQPKMSATPEDRVLNSQTGIDKSVVGPLANGWTGSRTQSRANTEQTGDAPPGLRAAERSLDTSLPRLSSGQQANADKMGLASFVNEEVRQGSKQPESRIAPPESDIRLAPQQVVTPPSSFGQPTTFVTRDALRPTSKGEDIGKVNFEHVPEMRQDARIGGAPTVLTQLVKPEMSQTVIRQMTDAVRAQVTAEKSVEISLRPAELGRVRIALSPADAGMIVSISAERAETLEMMRRNIDDLARSFAEMGHENLTFSFEQNGAFDHKDDQPMYTDLADENVSTDTTTELENQTPIPVLRTQNTGVDILV